MAHEHDVYTLLADAAARERDLDALRQFAPKAEELAARDGHALYLAVAQRAGGVATRLAGDFAEAEAKLTGALDSFQQLGARWQAGRTLVELGELARDRSEGEAARDFFAKALAEFEVLGARPDAERMKALAA